MTTRKLLVQALVVVTMEAAALLLPGRLHASPRICGGPVCTSYCGISCAELTEGVCPVDGGCVYDYLYTCPGEYMKLCGDS